MKSASILHGPVARADARGRATGSGRRSAEYERLLARVRLGRAGRCPKRPGLFIVVADDSGSVCGGNDPLGRRYDEIGYALRKVGAACTCGECLAAIVHFDVPTNADVPPTPIKRKHQQKLEAGLTVPSNAASSNLGPALNSAYKLAKRHPRHDATLIAATDFELFDHDFDHVMKRFVAFPGTVHAMVLNTSPLPILTRSSNVTVSEVDARSSIGSVAISVFGTLTAGRINASPAPQHHAQF